MQNTTTIRAKCRLHTVVVGNVRFDSHSRVFRVRLILDELDASETVEVSRNPVFFLVFLLLKMTWSVGTLGTLVSLCWEHWSHFVGNTGLTLLFFHAPKKKFETKFYSKSGKPIHWMIQH